MNRKIVIASVATLALVGGGVAYASIPDSGTGVYTACVKNSQVFLSSAHDVRMLDKQAGESCPSGWTEKSWNQAAAPTGPTYVRLSVGNGTVVVSCDAGDNIVGGGAVDNSGTGIGFSAPWDSSGSGFVNPSNSNVDNFDSWAAGANSGGGVTSYAICTGG